MLSDTKVHDFDLVLENYVLTFSINLFRNSQYIWENLAILLRHENMVGAMTIVAWLPLSENFALRTVTEEVPVFFNIILRLINETNRRKQEVAQNMLSSFDWDCHQCQCHFEIVMTTVRFERL